MFWLENSVKTERSILQAASRFKLRFSPNNFTEESVLNSENTPRFSVKYAGFWEGDGLVNGVFSTTPDAAADDVLSLGELTAWNLSWSGNESVSAFSISSGEGSVTALLPPGGFLLKGSNTAFGVNGSDADGLDQGLYEAGDRSIDLGALLVLNGAANTVAEGSLTVGSISVSPVVDFGVQYLGFWAGGGAVSGVISASEADAADGVISLDELVDWSWDWSGNSEVDAFSLSSAESAAIALLPPGGFLLNQPSGVLDTTLIDPQGLDQGLYESEDGDRAIDLGALLIQDFAANRLAQGDPLRGLITIQAHGENPQTDADRLIYGNGQLLTLVGGAGNDGLYGSDRAEVFSGGAGNDKIYANGGADVIDSGTGLDEVWLGGMGNATILLSEA
ncbi:MAG: hypothetical protein HC857_13935 [Synechococcales cyanobacterium RU_4_20]|nr:hypothetical protein [Synechococcales cyanobacterium RU_4_20]